MAHELIPIFSLKCTVCNGAGHLFNECGNNVNSDQDDVLEHESNADSQDDSNLENDGKGSDELHSDD